MASIFQSLLLVIAGSTQRELARQVKYLKVENQILRSKLPERITVTAKERQRLLKFGAKLGKALHQLVTIVTPSTFLRWIREAKKNAPPAKRGRKRTPEEIRKLIIRMAKENGWGYARIAGELRKLRITSVHRSTIRNILKETGHEPGPRRGEGTWDKFLKQHAASLWQCDFFSQKVLTLKTALAFFDWTQRAAEMWRGSNNSIRREILDSVCLNRTLGDVNLVTTKRKPFDAFAEGLNSNDSRGDKTAIELFLAGVQDWEARVQQSVGRLGDETRREQPSSPADGAE